LAVALALLSLSACKDDFGGYYNQPSYVSSSSDEVLKARSDCKTYLKLVNKTLFKKQVEGSGQYTFLVPTDDAFDAFFASNPYGYKSVDDIPEDVAARMVSSWMMYNSYPCDTLANVVEGFNNWENHKNSVFKHLTPSYDVLREEVIDNEKCQIYEFVTDATSFRLDNNAPAWNNYRYLPVFTERFNRNFSITSADWQKVVGSEFSPYGNYMQAGIIDAGSSAVNPGDLFCQNGVIHLVNKVVMPLENMDAIIRTYGDGSAVDQPANSKEGAWRLLRQMLYHKQGNGSYTFVKLTENATASHYFEKAYPDKDMSNLLFRSYNTDNAPYSLNIESYTTMQNVMASSDLTFDNYNGGMTFFVPQKQVLLDYINNYLFRHTDVKITDSTSQEEFDEAFNKLSDNVIVTLWASMQADGIIWPSQFAQSATNSVGSNESINGYDSNVSYDNSVVAAGMASNAMWHITNFVPKTSAFEGIASRFLLDPSYSIEEDILTNTYKSSIYGNMLKSRLADMSDIDLSLILWGDANMKWWDNIHYSTLLSAYSNYKEGEGKETDSNVSGLLRTNLLNSYIERMTSDPLDLEVDPLNGVYGGWAYTNNYNGDVLRYRKSGKTIDGKPEIQIQSFWNILNDENERKLLSDVLSDKKEELPDRLQITEPTATSYASVVKDNSTQYVNGNVYLCTEHSTPISYSAEGTFGDGAQYYNTSLSIYNYLWAYLASDAKSANPQHRIFGKFFDYYIENKAKKGNAEELNFGSGNWTIYVPTDAALQFAIDYKKSADDIELLKDPNSLPKEPVADGVNWVDSVIYFINSYVTKSGCYPDDGLSALYETTEAWNGIAGGANRQPNSHYLVTTNCKVTDVDRVTSSGTIIKPWSALITGATMSGYVDKVEGKLKYYGRNYEPNSVLMVRAYNSCDLSSKFDNTVVREQGQSNIMGPNLMIHSLNGFVIYKIEGH